MKTSKYDWWMAITTICAMCFLITVGCLAYLGYFRSPFDLSDAIRSLFGSVFGAIFVVGFVVNWVLVVKYFLGASEKVKLDIEWIRGSGATTYKYPAYTADYQIYRLTATEMPKGWNWDLSKNGRIVTSGDTDTVQGAKRNAENALDKVLADENSEVTK